MTKDERPSRQQLVNLTELYKQGRFEETLEEGEALAKQFPGEPIVANLLGAVCADLGHPEQAVHHYSRALQITPEFAEAHNNLGIALNRLGRPDEAVASFQRALQIRPDFADAHCNLGDALNAIGKPEEAVSSYRHALQLEPDSLVALINLGGVLNDLGRPELAVTSLTRAIQIQPNLAEAHNNLGTALNNLGKPEEAASSLARAVLAWPDFAEAHANLGATLNDLGKPEDARACISQALRINPALAEAHRFLSTIETYREGDPQIQQMLHLVEQEDLPDKDRVHLDFALAKAYEDIGDFDRAFSFYADGNRLRAEELEFDISSARAIFTRMKARFEEDVPNLSAGGVSASAETRKPVFVLGMPRSGTTLVEQILAGHSRVYGAGELALLGQSVNASARGTTSLMSDQLQSIRNSYLSGLAGIGMPEPYVTDKMTTNFLWIGFIVTAIPEARIVHVKRDARATCWSNFKHYFSGKGNGFAYDLECLTAYYRMYDDLMAFWHQKFPGRIYDLSYEALTENQEDETRKLLDHAGLDWEDQCLEFHKSERAVQTASVSQVRQEMYQGSSDEWRNYESHLGTLIESLKSY